MATCKTCQDPLLLTFSNQDDDDATEATGPAPDHLLLPCGCHFHWQCLLDQSTEVAISLRCPSCDAYLPVNSPGPSATHPFASASVPSSSGRRLPPAAAPGVSIPTRYENEGGVEEELDILPILTEEAFLCANPAARPARALHDLVSAGNVEGAADLLAGVQQRGSNDPDVMMHDDDQEAEDEGEKMPLPQLLTWRDPLGLGCTALHVAIEARREDAVWLLLWAGSPLPDGAFPDGVAQVARAAGLSRPGTAGSAAAAGGSGREGEGEGGGGGGQWGEKAVVAGPQDDVRFATDYRGRRPADLLREMGPPWSRYVDGGLFSS